jgi:hypothetical protein
VRQSNRQHLTHANPDVHAPLVLGLQIAVQRGLFAANVRDGRHRTDTLLELIRVRAGSVARMRPRNDCERAPKPRVFRNVLVSGPASGAPSRPRTPYPNPSAGCRRRRSHKRQRPPDQGGQLSERTSNVDTETVSNHREPFVILPFGRGFTSKASAFSAITWASLTKNAHCEHVRSSALAQLSAGRVGDCPSSWERIS